MASILSFLNQAVDSLISSESGLNTGCKLVLSCAGESVTFPVSCLLLKWAMFIIIAQ